MQGIRHCTVPLENGDECWNDPHPDNPFGVCKAHWRYLAATWAVDDIATHRTRCPFCGLISAVTNGEGIAICINTRCGMSHEVEPATTPKELAVLRQIHQEHHKHDPVALVYYMSWGNRIKIGTTTNLRQRMNTLYHDAVLAIEPGGYQVENQRHKQFRTAIVTGQKEWFTATPELIEHINTLRRQHGEPYAAADRLNAERQAA